MSQQHEEDTFFTQVSNAMTEAIKDVLAKEIDGIVSRVAETFKLRVDQVRNVVMKQTLESKGVSVPSAPAPPAPSTPAPIVNKCQHVINKRDGTTAVCNKRAVEQLDGSWLCGAYKANGSVTGHLGTRVRTARKGRIQAPARRRACAPSGEEKERPIDRLIARRRAELHHEEGETVEVKRVGQYNIHIPTRIILKKKGDVTLALGTLDTNGETVSFLTPNEVRWVEAHGFVVDTSSSSSLKSTARSKDDTVVNEEDEMSVSNVSKSDVEEDETAESSCDESSDIDLNDLM